MTEPDSLEARVAALEGAAIGRDERLTEGVERLTEETSGLNALLTRVDDQQRALADLQRRTTVSETRTEVVETSMQDFRKSVVSRTLTFALVLSGALLAVAGGLYVYVDNRQAEALRICQERNAGALLVQQYVTEQTAAIQADEFRSPDTKMREIAALQNLGRSFPVVNCSRVEV